MLRDSLSMVPDSPQPLPNCFVTYSLIGGYLSPSEVDPSGMRGTLLDTSQISQAVEPCSWLAPLFAHKAGLLSNC